MRFRYCEQNGVVVIHLVRTNLIRHMISRAAHQRDMSELGPRQDPHPRSVPDKLRPVHLIVYQR